MINLIAKNKIADYIEQHPETQTMLLVWLKEFELREGLSIARRIERGPSEVTSAATSPLGNGDYHIAYHVNFKLKAVYIEWVGSKEELEASIEAEFEKTKLLHPDAKLVKRVTTVVLIPPDFPAPSKVGIQGTEVNQNLLKANEAIAKFDDAPYTTSDLDFKTIAEYETALNRAIFIFDAQQGSSQFEELTALLPLIKYYEDTKLALPALDMQEVAKLKIKEWGVTMMMPQLTSVIGSEEDVELFLAGMKTLPDSTLQKLFRMFGVAF